jgi:hypothetical protein
MHAIKKQVLWGIFAKDAHVFMTLCLIRFPMPMPIAIPIPRIGGQQLAGTA